jgi:hypothetical protein
MNVTTRAQRRLAQMAGLELGWRVLAGELLAWVVTALALVMSYHAEQDLGRSLSAFHGWPSYVWPLSVDVADVALMVLYLEYKRLRLSTWKVALGMLAATTVMISANVRSVWPDPTAVAMQAWVPAIALWLWHTLASGRKPRGAPIDVETVWARLTAEGIGWPSIAPAAVPGDTQDAPTDAGGARQDSSSERPGPQASRRRGAGPNRPARIPARAEVRRLLKRHSSALTAEQVAERVGVSIPHARRLLREEGQLHVVETPAPVDSVSSETKA